ncbi:MAG TPA: hypothetical protein PKV16_05240 [Caldisericia bacterium]|nr:hypothetical protein [Caldisericia bacterium]HPF48718.1 hypothetical protein [Caldisericia bacterium]HPI83622.1 hypothetical protein [Caldisericia bacterium]HPQ93173.1 hypothetical protein [Caldisericia bacterium]HRV74994.1 hypothetical protein [Caldisericia bacterium]
MTIEIKEVETKKELKRFIHLPFEIHKGHDNWYSPLLRDEWAFFDEKRNEKFKSNKTVQLLALAGKKPVGRIMGIIPEALNKQNGTKTARFGFLECHDDVDVARALTEYVKIWAEKEGMDKLVGPMGFTDQDPEGYIIDGFEHKPTIATNINLPFIPKLLENLGFDKEVDYKVLQVPITDKNPPLYDKLRDRILDRGSFKLVEFGKRSQLKPYVLPILRLMNRTFIDLYGFTVYPDEELNKLAYQYIPLLNPEFVKVVEVADKVIGFIVAMPNIDDGLRKAKGRLFPGAIHILADMKRSTQLDLLLGAIDEEYRGKGADILMGAAMFKSARKHGFKVFDTHLELESNTKIHKEMEYAGGKIVKRYRIYKTSI